MFSRSPAVSPFRWTTRHLRAALDRRFAPGIKADRDPADRVASQQPAPGPASPAPLDALLEPIRARNRVPAVFAALVRGPESVHIGAVGVRRAASSAKVTLGDLVYIGSAAKPAAAILIGRLIEEGRLGWDTPLVDLFPELTRVISRGFREVTIEMLLHHRAGLPRNVDDVEIYERISCLGGTIREQRHAMVELLLSRPPAYPVGSRGPYANFSYTILGAAAERVTGCPWETLMRERVFNPLGMVTAGFGSPSRARGLQEPWGHQLLGVRRSRVACVSDNRLGPAIGPSGNIHLGMADWARYACYHLAAERGSHALVSRETYLRLMEPQPPGSGHAAGWFLSDGGPFGPLYRHVGSDGWWYAVITIARSRGRAALAACNMGYPRGAAACVEAIDAMMQDP